MQQKTPVFLMLLGALSAATATAAEIGHYAPGAFNIRDLAMPAPGFYGGIYNYWYVTSRLNDAHGDQVSSVTLGPGQGTTVNVNVDVAAYALAPTLIWVAKPKVLGAKVGLMIVPMFSNTSINGVLSSASGAGRSASTGQFHLGDSFVQPVWLSWNKTHVDVGYAYGFYIPTGKYTINTVSVPGAGAIRVEDAANTGYGFWTNQNQGSVYIYPWADRRLAIQNGLTWEIHRKKRGFDLTPGQNLTYSWGLSQYLPLRKDMSLLLEVGPSGYSSFQVSDDSGTSVKNPGLHDHVHAVGAQVGVTAPKRGMVLNAHWLHEFHSVDRFQGDSITLSFAFKF